jgi:hypothetical protein
MKMHIKLFEEFLKEEDPLASLTGGGEKKEEDPIKKMQDEERAKLKKREEKFDEYMDEKTADVKSLLDEMPDVKKEVGEVVMKALYSRDRVKIHNAINDLIYAQQYHQKNGHEGMIMKISKVKEILDDLDRSFSNSKMM